MSRCVTPLGEASCKSKSRARICSRSCNMSQQCTAAVARCRGIPDKQLLCMHAGRALISKAQSSEHNVTF